MPKVSCPPFYLPSNKEGRCYPVVILLPYHRANVSPSFPFVLTSLCPFNGIFNESIGLPFLVEILMRQNAKVSCPPFICLVVKSASSCSSPKVRQMCDVSPSYPFMIRFLFPFDGILDESIGLPFFVKQNAKSKLPAI